MDRNSDKNRSRLIIYYLALIALVVFYQVRSFEFVNYDDIDYVCKNLNIQAGITLKSVKWAFTASHASNWHPLTWLSHTLDWQLFKSKPAGHHLTNLVFHIANILLVFIVLNQMTRALWPSAFVAALFALHPLHVESVAWVSERKDVLSTFFWLLTMWAYIRFVRRPKISRYLLVVVFFALGLMAKPMLVTLPFVLLLLDYWPLDRLGPKFRKVDTKYSLSYLLVEKIPLFVMALASCIVTFILQKESGAMDMGERHSFFVRFANASISYLEYIIKMVWPSRLAMFYPHPGRNVSILYAVISAVFLLMVTVFVFRFAKNHRYLVTGWFWYLGTLVPVIGFVYVGVQAMADRYTYITLTGLFIIIAWGVPELLEKRLHRKFILWAFSLIVLSVLTICTYLQLGYWKDTITLCQHALDVTENNYVAHSSMARKLLEQGRIEESIRHNIEAVRIKPDDVDALSSLGSALRRAGRIDEAIDYYKKALEINPRHFHANFNLGAALAAKGRFDEAISCYNKALQIAPDLIEARTYLGLALADSGRFAEAVKEYEEVLRIQPQNVIAHIAFGSVLFKQGNFAEAVKEYEEVLRIQPQNAIAHNALGVVLLRQEKFDEAVAHFNQAVRLDPGYEVARRNLNSALDKKQKSQNKSEENAKK